MPQKLAVIGAGPKAAAIAAKAAALTHNKLAAPEVHIFDPDGPAAAWTGDHGFTDGLQSLCTLAERDLGFPYDTVIYTPDVARTMLASFSWQAFGVAEGRYGDWVLRGRKPPPHANFAAYIEWAIRGSGATVIPQLVDVISFDTASRKWTLSANGTLYEDFDGVVITGSGKDLPAIDGSNASSRVINGRTFWNHLYHIAALLRLEDDPSVAIIGAGGTAAAIANWLIQLNITELPITIIGREPTLYSRHANAFEDRYFSDEDGWDLLPPHSKQAYLARVLKGVVWNDVLQRLTSDNLKYLSYDVKKFRAISGPVKPGLAPPLAAQLFQTADPDDAVIDAYLKKHGQSRIPGPVPVALDELEASLYVDARGFNQWWFEELFAPTSVQKAYFASIPRTDVIAQMGHSLELGAGFSPNLHVPAIATVQGPAAANLMGLGWVADRILRAYVTRNSIVSP